MQASVCSEKNEGWSRIKRLGIDAISHRKGHQNFATVIGDIEAGKLMEVIDSQQQEDSSKALEQQPLAVSEPIEEVRVDLWGGFPKVVEKVVPNAVVVIDRFQVMTAVKEELHKTRRQAGILDRGSKFILLKNGKDFTPEQTAKLDLRRSKRLEKA